MAIDLSPITELPGFVAAAVVDSETGMVLATENRGSYDLELAAAGNTEVVRSKRRIMSSLNLNDKIEDILISLQKQYHLIRLLSSNDRGFIYVVLDRSQSNLALARMTIQKVDTSIRI